MEGSNDHASCDDFLKLYGRPPDFTVCYDDGDVMAYKLNDAKNTATDSDHHTLPTHQLIVISVGALAYAIWWNGADAPEEGSAPAEVCECSFTAEDVAAEHALARIKGRI